MADRERMDVDVLIVGAGPAGLATALRLSQLIQLHNSEIDQGRRRGEPLSTEGICVLEKGAAVGSHLLSGAVMDPRALRELLSQSDNSAQDSPGSCDVSSDEVYFLTEQRQWKLPVVPPFLHNAGSKIVSLNRLGRWLGEKVEEAGVTVFTGTAGKQLVVEGGRVAGVVTDDKGIDREGKKKENFEPGSELRAKVTVLAEGSRGSLTKELLHSEPLGERNPQTYAVGVKELWEIPAGRVPAGKVMHTAGWPLTSQQYGGGWLYVLPDNLVSLGLVSGLDYQDPRFDPHNAFQRFKTHPLIASVLHGGKLLKYGAKTIPEGGWYSLPPLSTRGALLVGDTAGFLNSQRLKGIHLAMKSGMLAAETIYQALTSGDFSDAALGKYPELVRKSWIHDELWPVRNYHQGMEGGIVRGAFHTALQMVSGGRGLRQRYPAREGHTHLRKLSALSRTSPAAYIPDGKRTFDKLTDVFHSGTHHEENQPSHLLIADTGICNDRCTTEYGNPCQYFCPAAVYEMAESAGKRELHLNPSNCVHCKTCDIMDPYQIITWVPPEGGGGPSYENL